MFCCGCLNTEAKLRILDENVTRAIRELLGLKDHDRYLYEYMCWMCYVALMKSIKFKEQCLEARNMVLSMVNVSRESLNTLHILNFKPNLSQSKVVLINVGPALETNDDSFFPIIQEIKSEVPDEGTFTDVNETSHDVKIFFTDDTTLSNDVVKNDKVFIEDDEIAQETIIFMADKDLKEEVVVKEECSDSSQGESVDIAAVESGTPSDDDTPLKEILKREDRINFAGIKTRAPARKRTLNEIPQKVKRIKLDNTTIDRNPIASADLIRLRKNNCRASYVSFSKTISVDSSVEIPKSRQIIKTTANCYEVNQISPKVNILLEDKVQAIGVIVQDHKTPKVCYSNAENETFKQCFSNSVDAVTPSNSLVRDEEGNKVNACNKKGSENEFMCYDTYQNKCVTGNALNVHKQCEEKPYICDVCDYRCSRKSDLNIHIKYRHTKEKNFSCHMCQYKCVRKEDLNTHLRKHTGEKPFVCDLCDYKFSDKRNLRSHINCKHTKEKNYSCHICQYKCFTKSNLNVHLRKHTGEKPYKCDSCDNTFSQQGQLRRHIMYKHTKEKNFSCHLCQYKCVGKDILNRHLRKHTEIKPYVCDLCDYKFSDRDNLRSHIKFKHAKQKNFSCHICQYKFVTKSNLNVHLRKHTGEKPYTCDFCDNRFSQHGQLRRHIMYKHTKEKNFSCHLCQYKCVGKDVLNRHLRKHTEEKPYLCDLCDHKFSDKLNLGRHIKYVHTKEKNFSCHICQYKCVTKSNLNVHLRRHTGEKPYTCDLCDNTFSQQGQLRRHIMHKHTKEKNFSCHMCQYKCVSKVDLNRHLRKHTGEKPYKCEICDFKCAHLSNLKSHLKSKHA